MYNQVNIYVYTYVQSSKHICSQNFNGSNSDWLIHLGLLELSSWSLQVILGIIHPGWVELPLARKKIHGPKPVPAIEVLLYVFSQGTQISSHVQSRNRCVRCTIK